MTAPSSAEVPPSLAAVIDNELEAILGTKGPAAEEARKSLWGLALSGGGIRSATFALGLLQSLAREKALGGFHNLSTVSGGGYAGAFLQGAIQRFNLEGACDLLTAAVHDDEARLGDPPSMPANRPLRHLREYSNYLSPKKAAMSGDTLGMIATYLRNVLLTQSQLLSLMLVIGLLPLCLAPLFEMLARDPVLALGLTAFFAVVGMTGLAVLSAAAQKQGYGFMEAPDVPQALMASADHGGVVIDLMEATYFTSRETVLGSRHRGMPWWRDRIFQVMHRNAAPASGYFRIPPGRLMEVGSQVQI